jgi:propanol-preferring alcohol dehydrogenase
MPIIPGHEIVGRVAGIGAGVRGFSENQPVGIPWLGGTCSQCQFCLKGKENLCDKAVFTGYQRNGGYAEFTVANATYCFVLPNAYQGPEAAPLLCAGLVGWRALKLAGTGKRLGLYGFGAAAHLLIQVANYQGRQTYAFTRPADTAAQKFALGLGAVWAGSSTQLPPEPLDAAIIFAPVGELVPSALKATTKGGVVVCGGIHMSDIPQFPYRLLWEERTLCSVANLTRTDALEFLELAPKIQLKTTIQTYPLADANQALKDLREGAVQGAAVLTVSSNPSVNAGVY